MKIQLSVLLYFIFFFCKVSIANYYPEEKNITISLSENKLTAGETLSLVLNPGSKSPQ